jgi:hypothetical protein
MKHLKPLNKKAALLEQAAAEGKAEEVQLMQTVAGCASTLDPGWEVSIRSAGWPACASPWRRTCMAAPILAGGRPRSRTP